MTNEEARTFLRRWWGGVWRDGNLGVVDELVAERLSQHTARGNLILTRAELKDRLVQYQRVLHRPVTVVDDCTADGDKLWFRATSTGVNLETGAPTVVSWLAVYRLEDGRLAEVWVTTVPDVSWTGPRVTPDRAG